MTNKEFLKVVKKSFMAYLGVGTSTSTTKLIGLHGAIALDLSKKYGKEFEVSSKCSEEYADKLKNKEIKVDGRYYKKAVDITVCHKGEPVAGYAVKFVMRNYSQNSNNYFENMLGETANLRSKNFPYFQIFIIFSKVPYYKDNGIFKKYDKISAHNLDKYLILSKDEPSVFYHTPDKALIILLDLKEKVSDYKFKDKNEYADYYKSVINNDDLITYADNSGDPFSNTVIYNDYEDFINRTYHIVMGKLKK